MSDEQDRQPPGTPETDAVPAPPERTAPETAAEPVTAPEPEIALEPEIAPEPEVTSEPGDTVAPPTGLAPSPGIAPPSIQQPTTSFAPPSTTFEPSSTGFEPAATGFEPAATGFEPSSTGFEPAATGFEPAATGFESPSTSFTPATSGFTAPQQSAFTSPMPDHRQQAPAQQGAWPPAGVPTYQQPPASGTPGAPGTPKRSGALVLWLSIGAGVLILILVAVIVAGISFGRMVSSSGAEPAPISGEGAAQTVEQYLHAVADGDADAALEILGNPQMSGADILLTDRVLAYSAEVAPITNIRVDPDLHDATSYDGVITATFDIGDVTVDRDFRLWSYGDTWEISDGLISFSLNQLEGYEPRVNGTAVDGADYLVAFPGAYAVSIELEHFEAAGSNGPIVLGSKDDAQELYSLTPGLTDDGLELFRSMVTESLEECLESTEPTTPCGMNLDETYSTDEPPKGAITRSLTTEGATALERLSPNISYNVVGLVSTYDYIGVEITVDTDDSTHPITIFSALADPVIDFTKDELEVVWE